MFVGRVDNVLIDFICDDVGVILLCEVCDKQKLLLGKDFAAGVRGVAENERLGVLLECLLQLRWVKVKFRRMQGHIDRFSPGEDGVGPVVFIEGGEDDDFIAGVGHGHHSGHHRLGAAAGDDDLSVGVHGVAHEPGLLRGQRLPEALGAPGDGILVKVLIGDLRKTVHQFLGRVKVGEALGEVHGVVLG